MILVVDSGSTKSDWVLIKEDGSQKRFSTIGFNPHFHDEAKITKAISQNESLTSFRTSVVNIYYYGAGCSNDSLITIVKNAIGNIFTSASIHVDNDLAACAYSTYEGEPAISCILGTGSNSCFFDGKQIYKETPSLGYILGDEGSGSYFGKQLLSAYLYKKLPPHIHTDFVDTYKVGKDDILENIYQRPHANVYIASFVAFISRHKNDPFFQTIILTGLEHFMKTHVCCFKNYKEVKIHFVGSIGYYFKDELYEVAKKLGVKVGSIIKKPIEGLVGYHLS